MAETARPSDSDAELVKAVQSGDAEAFDELFRRHYRSVRRACDRRLNDKVDAEEVAQATFVKAFERIDQCVGHRRFGPWVHVISQRLCVDTIRARARVQPEEAPEAAEPAETGTGHGGHGGRATRATPARQEEWAAPPGSPEDSVLHQEQSEHLQRALAKLSRRQREAVVARAVEEQRPAEIATSLGLSISAVDSLLLRARRSLAVAYTRVAGE